MVTALVTGVTTIRFSTGITTLFITKYLLWYNDGTILPIIDYSSPSNFKLYLSGLGPFGNCSGDGNTIHLFLSIHFL